MRADGGLNIGQNTNGNLFLGYQSGNATLTGKGGDEVVGVGHVLPPAAVADEFLKAVVGVEAVGKRPWAKAALTNRSRVALEVLGGQEGNEGRVFGAVKFGDGLLAGDRPGQFAHAPTLGSGRLGPSPAAGRPLPYPASSQKPDYPMFIDSIEAE